MIPVKISAMNLPECSILVVELSLNCNHLLIRILCTFFPQNAWYIIGLCTWSGRGLGIEPIRSLEGCCWRLFKIKAGFLHGFTVTEV